jgi:predicted metal-dependent peptidase
MANRPSRAQRLDPATEAFLQARVFISRHPFCAPLAGRAQIVRLRGDTRIPAGAWAVVFSDGTIAAHPTRKGSVDEWSYVLAHALLHLGLGHVPEREPVDPNAWALAADIAVSRFLDPLKIGQRPQEYVLDFAPTLPRQWSALYETLAAQPLNYTSDLRYLKLTAWQRRTDYRRLLTAGIRQALDSAVSQAAGAEVDEWGRLARPQSVVARARDWFVSSYPLLGALAASFDLIEDRDVCARLDIRVAAVSAADRKLYFNPLAALSADEARFVVAHEFLHVALRHDRRVDGRDPFLWNVAADYAINLWLTEMEVGQPPAIGLLLDDQLQGLSAETIYDRIAKDMRLRRRLATFRDTGKGDILTADEGFWNRQAGTDLDAFYRQALAQGLSYHQQHQRGLLPAGLLEEIRAQTQPPIPWEVELADWFDAFFAPIETRRSYARPSRRQASTPGIPRPRTVATETALDGRTFGVVLDTSGSMDRILLARALGAIAAYAYSRDVPAVRVVFCDARAYDAGYMAADDIAGRVQVRGRGGTVLQPGIDLLGQADDFPNQAPILIITDTYCESTLRVRGEHAYLIPQGQRLPFPAKGPVFAMPPSQAEDAW